MSDYDEYIVPVNPPPPMPHLSLRINTDNYAPPEVIIRSRGNLHDYSLPHFRIGGRSGSSSHSFSSRDHQQRYISIMQIGFNPSRSMLMQPEAIDLTLQGTMIPNENPFYSESPELFGHTLDLTNSIFSSSASTNPQFSGYQMRRRRYDREQWVRPFNSALNPGSSAFPSVEYFQRTSADIRRISPWLHRELTVLLSLRRSRAEMAHVYDVIISLLRRYDIRSQEFREHIRSYFGRNARQFQHEFFHFVLSGYTMEEYDRVAVYRESETAASSTAPNIGSVSTPPVFTIDSDDDSTESIPAANQANNPPSTSGTQNQSSSIEIVISDDDDDDGPPPLPVYPLHQSSRRRNSPLSPALNEEEYHMLSDMLEGSTSRLGRSDRRGVQHRTLSPTTEEFLEALDPFDLSDPPTNHHNDFIDFDYDASRPHSTIDLNNLSSGNRAPSSSSRPSSSRNSSTNAITSGCSDPASSLSEALMRFVDNNPLSSSTPQSARERASATIDMITALQSRTTGLSRRDRSANIHDPLDGRRNPRPSRYTNLFSLIDENGPRRPTRRCSGRPSDHQRSSNQSVIWERQTPDMERTSSSPIFSDDTPVPLDSTRESTTLQSDSSNIGEGSSVQIRIFPPAMDLSSRNSSSNQPKPSSSSHLHATNGMMQPRTHTNRTSSNGSAAAPQASNRVSTPEEDECEFLMVQPVYKKPPLAVITLSSDDDEDEDRAQRNQNAADATTEPNQSSSYSTRDPYGDLLRAIRMLPSSSRSNSNAELSSLPTENMVDRHLDAIASGFAYPMSMSSTSYPDPPIEQNRRARDTEERVSTDSDGGLGEGSDQVPSTSSLFRAYEVYPSSENNACDPRSSSARSSSVEFDLLSIPTSSSSNESNTFSTNLKLSVKSKKKASVSADIRSKPKKRRSKPRKSNGSEKDSSNQPGPSKQMKRKSYKTVDKTEKSSHKKKQDKYKRLRRHSPSSHEEEDNFPSLERQQSPVAAKKRSRRDSSPCLPDISDVDEDYNSPKKKIRIKKSKGKKSKGKSKCSKKEKKGDVIDNNQDQAETQVTSIPPISEPEPAVPSSSTGATSTFYFNPGKKLKSLVFKVQKPQIGSSKKFTLLSDSSSDEDESEFGSRYGHQKKLRSVVTTPAVNSAPSVSSNSSSNGIFAAIDRAWPPINVFDTKSDSSTSSGSVLGNGLSMTSETLPCVPRKKLLRRWESEDDESHTKEPQQATWLPENVSFAYSSSSSDEDYGNDQQRNKSNSESEDEANSKLKCSTKQGSLYL